MSVLPTIPGYPSIISTWVITPTPGTGFIMGMVDTADILSVSPMATHRGITPIVAMVTIHHGTPLILTAMAGEMTAMREMTIMTAATGIENEWMVTSCPLTTVMRKPGLAMTVGHVLAVMFQPRLPDIPETGVW